MKKCSVCKIKLNKGNAVKNKTKSFGIDNTCKKCNRERVKIWIEKNRERYLQQHREYAKKNSKKAVERVREWRKKNKQRRNKYERTRYRANPIHKLQVSIRNSIGKSIKRRVIQSKDLIGCEYSELTLHLEKQFTDGMSWENYGKWHIDHIKPLSAFNLNEESQQLLAFNYKNLQPLWAEDNLKKSNKYEEHL